MNPPIRIATRGSQLALWQARHVQHALRSIGEHADAELRVIRTTGDRVLDVPLSRIGDRGLFTKEIDDALFRGDAELAVHSLKDVPTQLPAGLVLGAVMEREDPRDVLLVRAGVPPRLQDLPAGATVGTSSLRRRAQLYASRPDLQVADLRGNLNTRLAKLDAGEYDAIVLAAAGVLRLGWADRVADVLDPPEWLPAAGQGALAVVARADDTRSLSLLAPLQDAGTAAAVAAERAFLHALEGGCQVPIGALAAVRDGVVVLDGLIASLDGVEVLRSRARGPVTDAVGVGAWLADQLLAQGAGRILDTIRNVAEPVFPAPAAP